MEETYLIVGAESYVGARLAAYLLRAHEQATVVSLCERKPSSSSADERHIMAGADFSNAASLDRAFTSYDPRYVVNCLEFLEGERASKAADVAARSCAQTVALLEAACGDWAEPDGTFGEHLFVQLSRASVYGAGTQKAYEKTPMRPADAFAAAAACAELQVWASELPAVVLRCAEVFGPKQPNSSLIGAMAKAALSAKTITLHGDGSHCPDLLYIDDLCRGVDAALHVGKVGETYNLSVAGQLTEHEIAQAVIAGCAAAYGDAGISDALIKEGPEAATSLRPVSVSKAMIELGWKPETPFAQGLANAVVSYLPDPDRP